MPETLHIAAIGELLWDLLPDGPQLGGAPANFAAILAQMLAGNASDTRGEVFLVSCIGNDPLGTQAREQLIARLVRPDFISFDNSHATGTVDVRFDANHSPKYEIRGNVAWDYIAQTPALSVLGPTLDAICFGTLAQRSSVTRNTLRALVAATRPDCVRVFDVNLRAPHWTAEAILWGCAHSSLLKMNHEEVADIANVIGAPENSAPLQLAHSLLHRFPVQLVAITRGPQGSLLVTRDDMYDHPGIPAHVADSIGAGDCFTAGLTYSSLHHQNLPIMAEAANRWGAWAASQRGGMPFLDSASKTYLEAAVQRIPNSQSYPNS